MGSISASKTSVAAPYPPGIHVPTLTWFCNDRSQDIDWSLQTQHIRFLIESGVHGIVIAGTNGEGAALSQNEKMRLVQLARQQATEIKTTHFPITVGCAGGCTRAVIEETVAAAEAGADFALILVPSYFHFAMDANAIREFFMETADASPIPVVIYNFPGVAAGLDVNSELLDQLGEHPNIVAVKLTCGGIAKVARVAAKFGHFSREESSAFRALAGQSDWLIPALSVGGAGSITGLANLYPKACVKMYDLWMAGKREEAESLQIEISRCEVGFGVGGINGTKWVVAKMREYPDNSCLCRRPYPVFSDTKKQAWVQAKMNLCLELEKSFN